MNCQGNKPDISKVVSEYLCLSCGACSAICATRAISFHETVGGYLFPKIDKGICNHCGVCFDVCPGINFGESLSALLPNDPFVGNILSCHVGRATCEGIFNNSQSGGVTTALLAHLLETKRITGVVVAIMRSAIPPRGDVLLATSVIELMAAQKSKYTPIPLLSAISRIRQMDGLFAFVGLPCHIHGLNNLFDLCSELRPKFSVKIGLVCDRIMTSAAVDFLGMQAGELPIRNLVFRDKQRPSYPGNPLVETESGKIITLTSSLRIAIKDFFTPARCRLCFDKMNIYSDVVLGDPHGISNVDRAYGETLVLTRTQLGCEIVSEAKLAGCISIRQASMQTAINGQGVNDKRKQWAGYMRAQSELGRTIPEYPISMRENVDSLNTNTRKCKASLQHSINLDAFGSRSELLTAANKWLQKRRILMALRWPFSKGKRLIDIIKRIQK